MAQTASLSVEGIRMNPALTTLLGLMLFVGCKAAPDVQEGSKANFFFFDARHPCLKAIAKNRQGFITVSIGQLDTSALESSHPFAALSKCVDKVNQEYSEADGVKASDVCLVEASSGLRTKCKIREKLTRPSPIDDKNTGNCQVGDTWETIVKAGADSKEVCANEYQLIFKDVSGKERKGGAYCNSGSALTAVADTKVYADLKKGYQPVTCRVTTQINPANYEQAPTKPEPN